jgi:hypothetical protein
MLKLTIAPLPVRAASASALTCVVLLVSGCGSSSTSVSNPARSTTQASDTSAPAAGNSANAPQTTGTATGSTTADSSTPGASATPAATYVGTIDVGDGSSTLYQESFSVTPFMYGNQGAAPPTDETAACGGDLGPTDQAVFVSGTTTVTYAKGTVPGELIPAWSTAGPLGGLQADGGPSVGRYALQVNGNWVCDDAISNGGWPGLTIQPGASVTIPFWITIPNEITNSHPRMTAVEVATTSIEPVMEDEANNAAGTNAVSGPQAFNCNQVLVLLPYANPATLPGLLNQVDDGGLAAECDHVR